MGINLDTLRPEPSVEGYTTLGGYSYKAVKPIALARVMQLAKMMAARGGYGGASLSGIGGVETGADAAEFILLGSDTVQVWLVVDWSWCVSSACVLGGSGAGLLRSFRTNQTPGQCAETPSTHLNPLHTHLNTPRKPKHCTKKTTHTTL